MELGLERASTIDEALGLALATLSRHGSNGALGPPGVTDVVTASRVLPAREAEFGSFPELVDDRLRRVLGEGGH